MNDAQYVIGLDGGGTKTAATLADSRGNVLVEVVGGPSNFQLIGVEQSAATLLSLIELCCKKASLSVDHVRTVVAGLTGAGRPADQQRMREGFMHLTKSRGVSFDRVVIESDARIALEGAFRGGPGIILISGTGSIAFGKSSDNNVLRVGGWGRILGDEGSGFAIGRDGLNAVTKELDGRGEKTILTELVATRSGLRTHEEIIAAVYRENFDIASVAPLVIEAAHLGDSVCERILDRASAELVEHVRSMVSKLEASSAQETKRIPLVFIGSVIQGGSGFSELLRKKISSSLPKVEVVEPSASPSYGAVLLALQ